MRNISVVVSVMVILAADYHVVRKASEPPTAQPAWVANEISVYYINVGQGDVNLIQSLNNAVLINGEVCPTQNPLVSYLRAPANMEAIDHDRGEERTIRRWVIDRFEGTFAVLENQETLTMEDIPQKYLPNGASEGHMLYDDGGVLRIDHEETAARFAQIRERFNKLLKKNI